MNVITGTSDSGKTAILRSHSWAVNNRPSGDAFKNWNVPLREPVAVTIGLDDGSFVILQRRDGKNSYSIIDKDGEETVFSAIKQDVPSEVSSLLNIAEYNFQSQHQPYFLLQDTPGEVAKKLNDLVGLSVIDKLFSNLASKIRKTSDRIFHLTSEKDGSEKELENYKNLDKIEKIIEKIEKLQGENVVTVSSLSQIEQKLSALRKIKEERENLIPLLDAEPKVDVLIKKITDVFAEGAKIVTINQCVVNLKKVREEIEQEKVWLDLEPIHTEISDKINKLYAIINQTAELETVINSGKSLAKYIEIEKQTMKNMATEYIELIRTSKICPTCGGKINAACLTTIEKSLS